MKTNVELSMPRIVYGDIFDHIKRNDSCDIIVPHVVNNAGHFDSGFASALARNYPIVKANYELLSIYKLGENQVIKIDEDKKRNLIFVNMIAQNGLPSKKNTRPLNYLSLVKCMALLNNFIKNNYNSIDSNKLEIHAPKFGAGSSGGNWSFISNLIEDIWSDHQVFIHIPKRN